MSFDLKYSHFTQILEKPVAAGESIAVEGLMVASILEGGVEKLKLPNDAADILLGFAITDTNNHANDPVVEQLVVPAVAPYQITLAHTPNLSFAMRVNSPVAGDLALGNPANPTEYSILGNVITVNAARAGELLTVYYRYDLTVAEAQLRYYQRNVNRYASQFYNQIAYGCDQGEIFLSTYDTSVDYSTFAPGTGLIVGTVAPLRGMITVGTLAGALAFPGHVIKLPTVADPMLGLAYQIVK